jgi:Xaa-Pro aminopeptidase
MARAELHGVELREVKLPDFGMPTTMPRIPAATHAERLRRTQERMRERGLDRLVVYADREHSANLAWLSGFDPRFEEAVLVLGPDHDPALLVGNECFGMAGAAPLPMRRHLFQDLSLPGQPRGRSQPLEEILADEGIGPGSRVGIVGWKSYARAGWLDVPAFLADTLRGMVGVRGTVEDANGLFIDPRDGLRTVNEVDQLAVFEYASCRTSDGVRRLIAGLQPGMTEQDAVAHLRWNGMPLSCHLMLSAGPRARLGLLSPEDRVIERGDPFTTAFGVWGALTCRAGFVVADAAELPASIRDYVPRLVAPYFEAVIEWYEALHIGLPGGELQAIIDRRLGDPFFGVFLNPGHLLGLDEWVHSPIFPGSDVPLRSGMAFQVDIIPATGTEHFTTNIEDGICLADEALREELADRYPDAWERIVARRRFMAEELGIRLHPDVLPLSNIPAWLPPFLLDPSRVMTSRASSVRGPNCRARTV